MFDEPEESRVEKARDPGVRAREAADEMRVHAQLGAVFEGIRKFDAGLYPGLSGEIAREIQRGMGKLEKAKVGEIPLLPEPVWGEAAELLELWRTRDLTTNDYHIHRRPAEVMIVRWLSGEQVQTFYERMQAHFDAAMEGLREDERQANEWKQNAGTAAYLEALEKIEVSMAERYLREPIRTHKVFVLSTQSADEMNIAHLCDYVMGVPVSEVVGSSFAPMDGGEASDLAWFFKLFSLRGMIGDVEGMCFFTYLQKTGEE
jgi:hypothetical protein